MDYLFLRKLDLRTRRAFQLERVPKTIPTKDEVLKFIVENRAIAFDASNIRSDQECKTNKKAVNIIAKRSANNNNSTVCKCCLKGNHKLFKCYKFKSLQTYTRLKFVKYHNM